MCVNPVLIRTASGDFRRVPCGRCIDCDNHRATKNNLLCICEGEHHKYVMFVTLTYDMQSVPIARIDRDGDGFLLRNITSRLAGVFEDDVIWRGFLSSRDLRNLNILYDENKFRYFARNTFPYTCSYEAQCFIKRLRYYIAESETVPVEQKAIRYYIASEYGPKSFRPHFHALIFTSSDALQTALPDLVHKAWPFGNSLVELSLGSAGQYTAQYTTANSFLPPVHKASRFIRPKALHSKEFGLRTSDELSKEEPFLTYDGLNNRFVQSGTKLIPIASSISLQSSLFPKCYSYANTTHIQRIQCYCLYQQAKRLFGEGYTLRQYTEFFNNFAATDSIHLLPSSVRWIYEKKAQDRVQGLTDNTFYGILSKSSQFLRNLKLLGLTADEYVRVIEQYYIDKEKVVLTNWYKNREKETFSPAQVIYDYDNIDDGSKYRRLQSFQDKRCASCDDSTSLSAPRSLRYLCDDLSISLPVLLCRYSKINSLKHNRKLAASYSNAEIIRNYRLKHKELQDANGFLES